jgi:hypothetical protein
MPICQVSNLRMSNAILAHLSSDTIVTALGLTVTSGIPVLALCGKLVESSTYASSTPLNAYRGDTLCLKVRSIGEAAKLEISASKGVGFRPRS